MRAATSRRSGNGFAKASGPLKIANFVMAIRRYSPLSESKRIMFNSPNSAWSSNARIATLANRVLWGVITIGW
jgi:hypothetical protein